MAGDGVRKSRHILHTKELFNKIRERLKLSEEVLPDKTIKEYYKYLNTELIKFLLDNPEGFAMTIGTNLNGVLAVSKHLPKEMRSDKFEKLEEIENFTHIPEWRKKILKKRYDVSLQRRVKYDSIKKPELEYHINTHSFFYSYKFMWFNHRNCKIKKTKAYLFKSCIAADKMLEERIRQGFDYSELNFNDFYRFRVRPIN
jgi:hypothetical protein